MLNALDENSLTENTVVVLWSDHGYHLGEKEMMGKTTLWERSTRVPLIFAGPGIVAGHCDQPVELLDIYPTLAVLAGLDEPSGIEGVSLVPQINSPMTKRTRPAVTTHNPGNFGIRSDRFRLIRYADGSEEFYDMVNDPNEFTNRSGQANSIPKPINCVSLSPTIQHHWPLGAGTEYWRNERMAGIGKGKEFDPAQRLIPTE